MASTKDTIEEMHDWGVGKIKNEVTFSQRALTNLDSILNETKEQEVPAELVPENGQEQLQGEQE